MNLTQRSWPLAQRSNRLCRHGHPVLSQPNADSQLAWRTRLLISAACAARAGAAQMTLSDWRDVEREVQWRLKHERTKLTE